MKETKSKKITNTQKEYEDALATSDPTIISDAELEDLAKNVCRIFSDSDLFSAWDMKK